GLEDGFLLGEYRKALKGRASPPCGKVAGMLLHHTNVADAEADRRKLVCYDCGVACDLSKMRGDRLVALRALGAWAPAPPAGAGGEGRALRAVSERGGGSPAEVRDETGGERASTPQDRTGDDTQDTQDMQDTQKVETERAGGAPRNRRDQQTGPAGAARGRET